MRVTPPSFKVKVEELGCHMKQLVLAYALVLVIAGLTGWTVSSWLAGQVDEEPTEISFVLVDPPANLEVGLHRIGFRPGERTELAELAMTTQVIHAPYGYTEAKARSVLRKHFPHLFFDFEELVWSH